MMNTRRVCLGLGALGVSAAFLAAPAWADPADPAVPAPPAVVPADPAQPVAAPVAAPAPVQHLSSPDNLPPGTTSDSAPEGRLNYLRDLLHAIRTQDVSGSDALLLLAQRPMDAGAAPPPGVAAGPSGPVGSSAAPPAVDASAPSPAPVG